MEIQSAKSIKKKTVHIEPQDIIDINKFVDVVEFEIDRLFSLGLCWSVFSWFFTF